MTNLDSMGRTDAEAEALILWPPDVKSWLIRQDPDAGKDGWMASPIQWTWVSASSGIWWRTGKHGVQQSMGSHGVTKSQTQLSDWTTRANLFFCEITFALCFLFLKGFYEFNSLLILNWEIFWPKYLLWFMTCPRLQTLVGSSIYLWKHNILFRQ